MFAMTAPPAEVADRLAAVDGARDSGRPMTVADRLAALADAESLAIWVDAVRTELLAALVREEEEDEDAPKVVAEVAFTLGVAETTVRLRAAAARELTGRLPASMDAMRRGELRWSHARVSPTRRPCSRTSWPPRWSAGCSRGTGDLRQCFHPVGHPSGAGRRPAAAEAAHEYGFSTRRVRVSSEPDGMAALWALLPAEGAAVVARGLRDLAGATPGQAADDRTLDQREADALVQVFTDLAGAAPGTRPRRRGGTRGRAAVSVTVSAETLLGLDDAPAALGAGRLSGPITASQARRIAADGIWRRLLTDPVSGALLDLGRERYRPPAELRAFVVARDARCTRPGCDQPSVACDLDHALDWVRGGATSAANLHCACGRCHSLKDVGWRVVRGSDGTTAWTTPRGVTRVTAEHDLRPEDRHRRTRGGVHCRIGNPLVARAAPRVLDENEPPVFEVPSPTRESAQPPPTHANDPPPF